jgi:hypothetical protein
LLSNSVARPRSCRAIVYRNLCDQTGHWGNIFLQKQIANMIFVPTWQLNVDIFAKLGTSKPWRRGIVIISSASRTEDPGFESRQGVRFLGLYRYIHYITVVKT